MRIVGGMWRGRQIEAPEGRAVTRPTTDRTRESIASMVLSAFDLDLSEVRVLDAFAGSGALGFEMLSRGAAHCTFVDADRQAMARVKRNARSLGADARACTFVTGDSFKAARRGLAGGPFSLVMLDPPYATDAMLVSSLVSDLSAEGLLAEEAYVLYERASQAPSLSVEGSVVVKSKSRGTTAVDLIRIGGIHDE